MENLLTISNLYRVALVLTGSVSQAELLVKGTVRGFVSRSSGESSRRVRWLMFQKLRQKALTLKNNKEETGNLPDVARKLHVLPEPSRSTMTLLCLDVFSLSDLESLLDLSVQELAEALDSARSILKQALCSTPPEPRGSSPLTGGGIKQRAFLAVCPPSRKDGEDMRLRKALQIARNNPHLSSLLESQIQFDGEIARDLRAIMPPLSLKESGEKLESVLAHPSVPTLSFRDPAIISVAVAFILLVGLAIWLVLGRLSSFPGATEAWRVVSEGDNFSWNRLEPVILKMKSLDDWFAMKGMDQFWAPSGLGNLEIIGGRVFTVSDIPIAMGVVDHPRMFFYAFNGARLGIFPPADGRWKILTREQKTIGVTRQGDAIFVVEIEGSRGDLQRILHSLASS